jgi:hypothetical protein
MNQRSSLSSSGKATVAALLFAAFRFAIQIFSGDEVLTVPPGLVILTFSAKAPDLCIIPRVVK